MLQNDFHIYLKNNIFIIGSSDVSLIFFNEKHIKGNCSELSFSNVRLNDEEAEFYELKHIFPKENNCEFGRLFFYDDI